MIDIIYDYYDEKEQFMEDSIMPMFEYRCECGRVIDHIIKFSDVRPDKIDCSCGKKAEYVISPKVGTLFPQGKCKGGYMRPSYNSIG